MKRSLVKILAAVVLSLGVRPAAAELPLIRLDRIFPTGAEAGSEVTLTIQGRDLDEAKALHFDHPGLTAEWAKPNEFRVKIAADVAPGSYDVRAVGKRGISGGRLFMVSQGLSEVLETEPNDVPEKAQEVPINAALNGQSDGNGDDYFRFHGKKGQRLTVDCWAYRLDSQLRASMALSTAGGKVVSQSKPYYDRTDPLLDVLLPDDGDYIVGLHDAIYGGGHPYRVILSDRPLLENASPLAVVPGETTELAILGRNLPGGKPMPELTVLGQPLDQVVIPFTAPGTEESGRGLAAIAPLPSPTINARGFQVRPKGMENAVNALNLLAAREALTREHEPNDGVSAAQEITLPTTINGRLDRPGDADWFTFQAKAGEAFAIDLFCERLDLPGDLRVIAMNDKGNELASVDDHGINFDALALNNRDPAGLFTAPGNGTVRLLVQDTYRNGGPRYAYALRVGKPRPDFYPVVFHETPNEPSCPVVRQGGSAFYELCLNRRDGLKEPVTIEVEGLPQGVSSPPFVIGEQRKFGTIVFTASGDAPEWSGPIRIKAWATVEGKRLEHQVRCAQRRWPIANINTSRECREICLAVRSQAPYALTFAEPSLSAAAGGTLEAKVLLKRFWTDFKGKVQLNGLNLTSGVSAPVTEIPEGKTEATVKFSIADNVPPGDYSVVLRGDAQVPFSPDPKAATKPNIRVADPTTALKIVVTARKQ